MYQVETGALGQGKCINVGRSLEFVEFTNNIPKKVISIIFVIRIPLLNDNKKQGDNHKKPGDLEKAGKTLSLPAKPGELTGLTFFSVK